MFPVVGEAVHTQHILHYTVLYWCPFCSGAHVHRVVVDAAPPAMSSTSMLRLAQRRATLGCTNGAKQVDKLLGLHKIAVNVPQRGAELYVQCGDKGEPHFIFVARIGTTQRNWAFTIRALLELTLFVMLLTACIKLV